MRAVRCPAVVMASCLLLSLLSVGSADEGGRTAGIDRGKPKLTPGAQPDKTNVKAPSASLARACAILSESKEALSETTIARINEGGVVILAVVLRLAAKGMGTVVPTASHPLTVRFSNAAKIGKVSEFSLKDPKVSVVASISTQKLLMELAMKPPESSTPGVYTRIHDPQWRIMSGYILFAGSLAFSGERMRFLTGQVSLKGLTSEARFTSGTQCQIGRKTYVFDGGKWKAPLGVPADVARNKHKERAFVAVMKYARETLASMPSRTMKLTEAQKSELLRLEGGLQIALNYKPEDRQALALKARIPPLLGYSRRLTLPLANGVAMKLVYIKAGRFMMGGEHPRHQVTISTPFYMGVTEVTQAQWLAVMNTEPWKASLWATANGNHAASRISWNDAAAFCAAVSTKTGRTVRLPTEAEWEYACRAGTTTAYSFGDDSAKLADYAWYSSNASKKGEKHAHLVGQKKPNPWGLYDMHGNVLEWCADWFAGSYANTKGRDPEGPAVGDKRVLRGGSWMSYPGACRAAWRGRGAPTVGVGLYGFRVVALRGSGATVTPSP
jgi:formylglycine-generating enzyme required for sulfatase activity